MQKKIRPLTAFKKANPDLYLKLWNLIPNETSPKGKENEFYFYYACKYMNKDISNEVLDPYQIDLIERTKKWYLEKGESKDEIENVINRIKKGTQHLTKIEYNSFFFNSVGEKTNVGTVSEIGRFLLYGWYYDVEEWSRETSEYIYNAYEKIKNKGDVFNDLDFQKAVKHLRENIKYYYQNNKELKLYILETFFNNKLKELLPEPPEKLKRWNEIIEFLTEIRKNDKAKGIDFWINKANDYESYYFYLQEILENLGFDDFLKFKEYTKEQNANSDEYFKEINEIHKTYKKDILSTVKNIELI